MRAAPLSRLRGRVEDEEGQAGRERGRRSPSRKETRKESEKEYEEEEGERGRGVRKSTRKRKENAEGSTEPRPSFARGSPHSPVVSSLR